MAAAQSLPSVARIPVIKSTDRGALTRDVLQVAEGDYLHVLRSIAAQEIAQQRAIGNPPSGMLVDGSKSKQLEEATRSVVVYFADRRALADAIIAAKHALDRLGRSVTGRTLGAATFYYTTRRGGALTKTSDPRSIALAAANPAALDLYVTIEQKQVRAWQWLSRSGSRAQRKTRNKKLLRYSKATGQKAMQVSSSVFERAAKQTQRTFRSIDVLDMYLAVPNLNPRGRVAVDRIPAIKVRMAVRGRGGR